MFSILRLRDDNALIVQDITILVFDNNSMICQYLSVLREYENKTCYDIWADGDALG